MVKLNKIYTRTGDDGTTGLATGARWFKSHPRIEAYGTVDETNAVLGMAMVTLENEGTNYDNIIDLEAMMLRIQNDLFDLGADLSTPEDPEAESKTTPLRITEEQVQRIEAEIDQLNKELQPLTSFILPGGNPVSAHLHLARTICRRAERAMVELNAMPDETVSDPALKFINRLSDHLFVLARYLNERGLSDILWTPGQNRK